MSRYNGRRKLWLSFLTLMDIKTCLQTVLTHIDAPMKDMQAIFKTVMDMRLNNWPTDALVSQLIVALSEHRKETGVVTWDPLKVEPFNLLSKPSARLHPALIR